MPTHKHALRFAHAGLVSLLVLFAGSFFTPVYASPPHSSTPPHNSKQPIKTVAVGDADTDGDGLSNFQEVHKYFTDPHKKDTAGKGTSDGEANQRKEFTYTITSTMKILKPCRPADMNDDYQDVRVLAEDKDSYTLEITYYPLNTNRQAIGANRNWKHYDKGVEAYLKPTPAANWDAKMRTDLLAELKKAGIEPDKLTDKQLVEKVSHWAIRYARASDVFSIWFVAFPNGVPTVAPDLRHAFDAQKPNKNTTDQAMFERETLGRGMFYNKTYGTCTSASTFMTTILRALGIPTRIVVCIPPTDGNDTKQIQMLLDGIHHYKVRNTVDKGVDNRGFSNHLFNEVYVGHRWVRLNYNRLGQNILDEDYCGLLTHIYTVKDISELPLAQTWGRRFARDSNWEPKLSSINPYMLLAVSDHFGKYSSIANPKITPPELRAVTINAVYWRDAPANPTSMLRGKDWYHEIDFLFGIKEVIPNQNYRQLTRFHRRAGHNFALKAPGHPDIPVILDGGTMVGKPRAPFQAFQARIPDEDKKKLVRGVAYTIQPLNISDVYKWSVAPGVVVRKP